MKPAFAIVTSLFVLGACSNPQGVGFSDYDVPAKSNTNGQSMVIEWDTLRPVPRVQFELVGNAAAAAAAPGAGIAAVSAPDTNLLLVEDGTRHWLVAKALKAPDLSLKSEAEQRSGCLVGDSAYVGATLVFALNCS
ncbi:hypothetical protein N4R57_05035 [Rhodobacteraceae bacterium D3-12]|nr:hypothetical protein N4R57_05035 [Rhodobacteraceae bacterium D3-12]